MDLKKLLPQSETQTDALARIRELNEKKRRQGGQLSPHEEGELRGWYAHPDDPEARELIKKETLQEAGLLTMTDGERERLRQIRAAKFAKTRHDITDRLVEREGGSDHYRDEKTSNKPSPNGKVHLDILATQARIASLQEDWSGDPKQIIDRMINDLPDQIKVYSKTELAQIPKGEPSPLELFLFSKVSSLDDFDDIRRGDGSLRVLESILCLRDKVRTKKFLTGVGEAVKKLQTQKDEVHVLDAGCGAIPIMAIHATLSSEKVHCTCVELNPHSARIARQIVQSMGLQDRIEVIEADATKFRPKREVDLLISETMHSGLTREMMVQIMGHLSQFVAKDGVKLPSKVTVEAAIVPLMDYAAPRGYTKINEGLHHCFDAKWKKVIDYYPGDRLKEIEFELDTEVLPEGSYFVVVNSQVEIGDQKLQPYDSLITTPQVVLAEGGDGNSSEELIPELVSIKGNERQPLKISYSPSDSLAGALKT